jgi:hypothetical protein
MRGNEIACPYCGKQVVVRPPISEAEIAELNRIGQERRGQEERARMAKAHETQNEAERIKNIADNFAWWAEWVAKFGIIAFVFVGIATVLGNEGSPIYAVYVGGAAAGLWAWLYFMAQIIYIRAALEKQRD